VVVDVGERRRALARDSEEKVYQAVPYLCDPGKK
jgi:hypothetical protein